MKQLCLHLQYIDPQPGQFIHLETGEVVGEHLGIHQWTIGQRCRLPGKMTPFYIVQKNKETQEMLVVSPRKSLNIPYKVYEGKKHPLYRFKIVTTQHCIALLYFLGNHIGFIVLQGC